MKKTIYLIACISIFIFACQNKSPQAESKTDSTQSNQAQTPHEVLPPGAINYTDAQRLKQGKWIEPLDKNNIPADTVSNGNYKDGKRDSIWTAYYHYNHGKTIFRSKINYVNGLAEGNAIFYNSKGQISKEGVYKNSVFVENKK